MDTKYPISQVLFSPIDERDYTYDMIASATDVILPKSFRLHYKFPVKNQGQTNSCVGHGLSELKEIIDDASEPLSPGFIYANRLDTDWQGVGMITREALLQLIRCGVPPTSSFPINEEYPSILNTLNTKYNKTLLLQKATMHKSTACFKLNIDEVKKFIYTEKKPVVCCLNVYENFYDAPSYKGVIPSPLGNRTGGHLTLILGWDENDRVIILNSWGSWGGSNGYLFASISNVKIFKELWGVTDTPINPIIEPITPKQPPNTVAYKVQLGAFRVRTNADMLIHELSVKGISACVALYPDMFKVQCGYFKIKDNAIAMRDKLISLGYKDAFILEVK